MHTQEHHALIFYHMHTCMLILDDTLVILAPVNSFQKIFRLNNNEPRIHLQVDENQFSTQREFAASLPLHRPLNTIPSVHAVFAPAAASEKKCSR